MMSAREGSESTGASDYTVAVDVATPPISESALPPTQAIPPRRPGPVAVVRASKPRAVVPPRLVAGSGPTLESETVRLLRRRLRAAIFFLVLAIGLFFVRNMFLAAASLRWLQGVVLVALAAAELVLTFRKTWTLRALREVEWGLFALVGLFAWVSLHMTLIEKLDPAIAETFAYPLRDGVRNVIMVVTLYGTFIPNQWKGAARVVLPFALVPFLAALSVAIERPDLAPKIAAEIGPFEQATGLILGFGLGVCLALYGAHTIHNLRKREHALRQFGQYRLLSIIGQGGMGQVFLAEHQMLKRPCAVKVIRGEDQLKAQAIVRFEREARSLARLTHPNSIAIFDYGTADDGSFYLAMEYIHGLTFDQLVERHGPLPPGRVIRLLRQICGALEEAHIQGMVHRDVKPTNLMIHAPPARYDVVKLLDFGLVLLDDPNQSRTGSMRGTPLFMAPEQAACSPRIDGRADLYALGGTAYYLLTGRPPFDPPDASSALIAHRLHTVERPSMLRADLPADLERIILRCLEKQPENRYADAASLDRALAACEAAATWTDGAAIDWWRTHERALIAPGRDAGPRAEASVNLA